MILNLKVVFQDIWIATGLWFFKRKKLIDIGFGFKRIFGLRFLDEYWTINQLPEQS